MSGGHLQVMERRQRRQKGRSNEVWIVRRREKEERTARSGERRKEETDSFCQPPTDSGTSWVGSWFLPSSLPLLFLSSSLRFLTDPLSTSFQGTKTCVRENKCEFALLNKESRENVILLCWMGKSNHLEVATMQILVLPCSLSIMEILALLLCSAV